MERVVGLTDVAQFVSFEDHEEWTVGEHPLFSLAEAVLEYWVDEEVPNPVFIR